MIQCSLAFSLLSVSNGLPISATLFPLSGPARGMHSIFSYFRKNLFHMCLIHLHLQKLRISSVQKPFQQFFFFPFLETGSCLWLRTDSSSAPGAYKMLGMRSGEDWGRLLYSLLPWGGCTSARDWLGSPWRGRLARTFLSLTAEPRA